MLTQTDRIEEHAKRIAEATKNLPGQAPATAPTHPRQVQLIIERVARYWNLRINSLVGRSRLKNIARARFVACYLIKIIRKSSFEQIGEWINRDHSTVIHAIRTVERLIEADPEFAQQVQHVMESLTDPPEGPALVDV
jgi:chromosomal replication initiation ATPase DnaA